MSYTALFNELIKCQSKFLDYSTVESSWLLEQTIRLYDTEHLDVLMNNLVLFYRGCRIGRYSLTFNSSVYKATKEQNTKAIIDIFTLPIECSSEHTRVVLSLAKYLDLHSLNQSVSLRQVMEPELLANEYIVIVDDCQCIWHFRELDLIFCLLSGAVNPMNNLPFTNVEELRVRFADGLKACQKERNRGYSHKYWS